MNRQKIFACVIILMANLLLTSNLFALDVTDYGLLPNIRSVTISPDGKHYAMIKRNDAGTGDQFLIVDVDKKEFVGGADASKVKARSVYFATNDHVILRTSKTRSSRYIRGDWEESRAFVYNLKNKKLYPLLRGVEDLYIAQSGLGRIVGINKKDNVVYMPAFAGDSNPQYHLYRVNLDTGRARRHAGGSSHVIDWFVDEQGVILAKEEYNERTNEHRVRSKVSGKWETIYSKNVPIREIGIVAISANKDKLIFNGSNGENDAIFSMSLKDGVIEGPLYEKDETDIDGILTSDLTRKFEGVLYSGFLPNYQYTDNTIQNNLGAMQGMFPTSAINPISFNENLSKTIISVSGNQGARDYYVFDVDKKSLTRLGSSYPNIQKEQIANVKVIKYKARDGLKISAVVTEPVGISEKKSLPMIVLPHGGPESYDNMSFDWLAQYFARKGYLVLQPNFRGSTGFGYEFRDAGRGKWGKEMQHDVSDGVAAMVKAGLADPERVCIIGASYGGYSALAGGAFTPELYKCVVSIAGVSDLPHMLKSERRNFGRNHWVVSYWNKVIGDSKTQQDKLREVSPINSAQSFTAPLLMLHGKDDTVVPVDQSKRMLKAMNRAGKDVELIYLNGEDHWLSTSQSRLALLEKVSGFLDKHNPAN